MRHFAAIVFTGLATAGLSVSATAQSAQNVVARHNAAYEARDLDAFMATFADDAVVVAEGFEIRGREQIAESYALNFHAQAPRVRVLRQGRIAGGGIVQEEAYVFADGSEQCCTISAIYVEDGRITRVIVDSDHLGG